MTVFQKKSTRIIAAVCAAVLLCAAACGIYLGDYYRADMDSIQAFASEAVRTDTLPGGDLVFYPEAAEAGLIFYPGGKVEYTAYIPLMKTLAADGILCVLVKMPGNLAVLDMAAAAGIPEQFPEIDAWYLAGHSLGGSMAASYLADHTDDFEGLILLGAYSTADLSNSGLVVLSLYGSQDLVMNREKYAKYRENLPADLTETVIDGGCHAYFGMYGAQEGDGIPTITNEEQITITAEAIRNLIR
jgi:hypothetical protein